MILADSAHAAALFAAATAGAAAFPPLSWSACAGSRPLPSHPALPPARRRAEPGRRGDTTITPYSPNPRRRPRGRRPPTGSAGRSEPAGHPEAGRFCPGRTAA